MTYWTLESQAVEKALADWGIDDLTATFVNQAEDLVELSLGGRPYDAAYLFPFKTEVIIRRDRVRAVDGSFSGGTQYFVGLVTRPHASASGRREGQGCAIVGPWWYLNERGFEQEYQIFAGWIGGVPANGPLLTTKTTNRIFLNQSPFAPGGLGLHKISTGEQLTEILNWTLKPFTDAATTPPFQIGTITLAVDAPIDEVKNITCAEAARKMFRWSPDAVAWFDYSTTPPTFHAQRRAELAAFDHDLSTIKPEGVSVTPRPDLQRPFVKINYERNNSVNGSSFLEIIEDVWPNPIPTGALNQFTGVPFTIDLRGSIVNRLSVGLETEAINASSNDWWLNALPEYKTAYSSSPQRVLLFAVDPATVEYKTEPGEDYLGLPNRLIGGTPADWVNKRFQRVTLTCKAHIKYSNGGELPDRTLSVSVLTTDATTGVYSTVSSEAGDPLPVNLARDFYEAVNALIYEGSVRFHRAEVGSLARLGHKLNFTGTAQTAWASMNALIQRVTETIFSGVTEIEFGTPPHLNLDDLVSLFFVARNRQITQSLLIRSGGSVGGGTAAFTAHTAQHNSSSAPGNPSVIVASGSPKPATEADPAKRGLITHDGTLKRSTWAGDAPDGIVVIAVGPDGAHGELVKIQETRGCDPVTGAPRYSMMLRSRWYETPLTNTYDS